MTIIPILNRKGFSQKDEGAEAPRHFYMDFCLKLQKSEITKIINKAGDFRYYSKQYTGKSVYFHKSPKKAHFKT